MIELHKLLLGVIGAIAIVNTLIFLNLHVAYTTQQGFAIKMDSSSNLQYTEEMKPYMKQDTPSVSVKKNIEVKSADNAANGEAGRPRNKSHTSDEHIRTDRYNVTEYQIQLDEALRPLPYQNITTYANMLPLWSGFCNQYMFFTGFLFFAIKEKEKVDQFIVESFVWKDTLGTQDGVPHELLWDIVHWNTYYPILPRFVRHTPEEFPDLVSQERSVQSQGKWLQGAPILRWLKREEDATKPYSLNGRQTVGINRFKEYEKFVSNDRIGKVQRQHTMFQAIAGGALRPHPEIQEMIRSHEEQLEHNFMAIHARIEPDMLEHNMCLDKKVNNITEILDMVYAKYPEPPVKNVLLVFNRPILEERFDHPSLSEDLRVLSKHNLAVINDIVKNGMWNGTVAVIEGGAVMVKDVSQNELYQYFNSIVGSVLNFFIAINAKIFIGTEISSYSTLAVATRFYRQNRENYFYYPEGLLWKTHPNATAPPRFRC